MKNILKKFLIIFIILVVALNIGLISNATQQDIDEDLDPVIQDLNADEDVQNYLSGNNNASSQSTQQTQQTIQDEDEDADEDLDYSDEEEFYNSYFPSTPVQNKNLFSFGSEDVTVDTGVYGDVFIVTSGKVTINAYITGNAFISAADVDVTMDGEVAGSLFCLSNNLAIEGYIDGNLYAMATNFTSLENSTISSDLFLTSNNVKLEGNLYRDAHISANNIEVAETAYISGDLNYSASNELTSLENIVDGEINYNNSSSDDSENKTNPILSQIYNIVSYAIFVVVIFLLLKLIKSKFINNNQTFVKNLWKYILFGLLSLIIVPVVSVLLLMLNITAKVSLLLFAIYILFAFVASSIAIINIANVLSSKIGNDFGDDSSSKLTFKTALFAVVLSIVYKLLNLVPILNIIITVAFVIIGFGILVKSLFTSEEEY